MSRKHNWFERNVVHPMAYGGDQAVNDYLGENGVLRPIASILGFDAWTPDIEEPADIFPSFASEIPRSIITSGGLAGAGTIPRMVAGGAISGAVRDPGGGRRGLDDAPKIRLANAIVGATGGLLGGVISKGIGRAAEKAWQLGPGRAGVKNIRDYGAFGNKYEGTRRLHGSPQEMEKSLNQLPTFRGKLRRGVRPDHPTELQQIQNLKAGDTYAPGKSLSADQYGGNSRDAAGGFINESDEFVRDGAKKAGPYVFIKTNNARNANGALGWDEVITLPKSEFRVERVVRDQEGNVTELYLTDLSRRSFSRTANDFVKNAGQKGAGLTWAAAERKGVKAAAMQKDARRHGRPGVRRDIEDAIRRGER